MFAYALAEKSPNGSLRFWNASGLSANPRSAHIFQHAKAAKHYLPYCQAVVDSPNGRNLTKAVILLFSVMQTQDAHDALEKELKC